MNKESKKRSKQKKFTKVSIPTPLFKKVKERIKGTEFASVSSYVTYVVSETVADEEEEGNEKPFSKEDEKLVKARLRALGYID